MSEVVAGVLVFYTPEDQDKEAVPGYSAVEGCPGHLGITTSHPMIILHPWLCCRLRQGISNKASVVSEGYPGCDAANPWNPSGQGLWLKPWQKPVFLLYNATEIAIIQETVTSTQFPPPCHPHKL